MASRVVAITYPNIDITFFVAEPHQSRLEVVSDVESTEEVEGCQLMLYSSASSVVIYADWVLGILIWLSPPVR